MYVGLIIHAYMYMWICNHMFITISVPIKIRVTRLGRVRM